MPVTTTDPPVSILVPAYNAERFIAESLESLLEQRFQGFEIIVCDDASTDGTGEIVRGMRDPRIRYVRNERNRGGYGAANRAAMFARGDFIAVYHADDVYDPEIVAAEVAFLKHNRGAGAVFCLDRFMDEEGLEYDCLKLPPELEGVRLLDQRTLTDALLRHKNTFLRTPSVMFRRAAFSLLGGFDQRGYGIAADLDMWLRMSARYSIGLIPQHMYSYRHFAEQWSRVYDRLRTEPELFFVLMDRHMARPRIRRMVTSAALSRYELWRAKDDAERAANHLMLGDARRALTTSAGTHLSPFMQAPDRSQALRVMALRTLVMSASLAGGGQLARGLVYWARFRRIPPADLQPPPDHASHSLSADEEFDEETEAGTKEQSLWE